MDYKIEEQATGDISYIISVAVYRGCYRHIQVDGLTTLEELSKIINKAFNFTGDLLSAFYMNNRVYDIESEYLIDEFDHRKRFETTLEQLDLFKGKKFMYLFDFGGEEWVFKCRVIDVLEEATPEYKILKRIGGDPKQYPIKEEIT